MRLTEFMRFLKQRSGNMAVIIALSLIPIIVGSGAAIDFGRAYLVKTRLAHALDAAGLAVGSSNPDGDLAGVLSRYFAANYPAEKLGVPANPSMSINEGVIQLSASASVSTTFLKMIGINVINVAASSKIIRETKGLEIVLVLDNTGSMANNGKIGTLRVAAQDLVDILFGTEQTPDNLFMGLVPFVTTVNIGNTQTARDLVRFPVPPNEYPNTVDTEWKGCVEARPAPNDTNDIFVPGDAQQGEWTPYFWEAETYYRFGTSSSRCQNRWWRPSQNPSPIPPLPRPTGRSGDPPFAAGLGGAGSFRNLDITPNTTRGPNQACPQPLTPLTNSRATLEAAIAEMTPWSGNGTMVNLGAVWGWRVLSPGAPFTEGRPYDDPDYNKAIVILTDGVNIFSSVSSRCTGTNPKYNSQYTGYGYASEGRLGTTSRSAAQAQLNQRLADTCENIKATGIVVYTIVFQLSDTDTLDLFRACASDPAKFFNSPGDEQLRAAFRSIGAELSNLRIAE